MKLKRYLNSDGETVLVTASGEDTAKAAGWKELPVTPYTAPIPADSGDDGSPSDGDKKQTDASPTDKPLDKLKLSELIEYAETIGVPAEQIAALRKPGASKKAAIQIISAHRGA